MRCSNIRAILVAAILSSSLARSATAQQFVYPVGNQDEVPTDSCTGANGFKISQGFDNTAHHTGIDLCACTPTYCAAGGDVRAIGRGIVASIRTCGDPTGRCGTRPSDQQTDFGNAIVIKHVLPDGIFYSLYGHMLDGSIQVAAGDLVCPGTTIGRVGSTGDSEAPHLHFAVKRDGSLSCGYIRQEPCLSVDSFANYYMEGPIRFVRDYKDAPFVASHEFSIKKNPNCVWEYGSSSGGGAVDLYDIGAANVSGTPGLDVWTSSSSLLDPPFVAGNSATTTIQAFDFSLPTSLLNLHPSNTQNSVIRWTAPETATYDFIGAFRGIDTTAGTTTDVHIGKNGSTFFDEEIFGFGDEVPFLFTAADLIAGDKMDFVVGHGPILGNGGQDHDSTGFNVMFIKRPSTVIAGPIVRTDGHIYYLLAPSSWTAAEATARSLGGHLATINDAAENDWVFSNIAPRAPAPGHLWIGLEDFDAPDPKTINSFHWISGDPSPYRNWRPDNPEFLSTEFCTLLVGPRVAPQELPSTWVNLICANIFSGVVELPCTAGASCPSATLSDDFNRPNNSSVGNGWSEYEPSGSAFIGNNTLRLTSPQPTAPGTCPCSTACNCNGAKVYRSLPQQTGVRVTGRFVMSGSGGIAPGFSRLRVLLRADGATSLRNGYGFYFHAFANVTSLFIADNSTDDIEGTYLGYVTGLPFSVGDDISFEMLVFNDNSVEVRLWLTGGSRPVPPTLASGPFTPTATGSNLAVVEATRDFVNADVSVDDIVIDTF